MAEPDRPTAKKGAPDRPGVLAPPPLIFAGFFAAGWGLDQLAPLGIFHGTAWQAAGTALIVTGGAIGIWVIALFRRAHTAIEPWKPTTALVTAGPFRRSRNPTYLAMALCHAGGALALALPWALAALLPALLVIDIGVIRREERYLSAKFGPSYGDYCHAVRRWL